MISKTSWFTFDEVLKVYPALAPSPNANNTQNWFTSMLTQASLQLRFVGIKDNGGTITSLIVNDIIDKLMNVVFDRQHDNYLYKVVQSCQDTEEYTLTEDDFKKAINKVINVLNLTMPKYLPILYQYEEQYQNPLKKLESESESLSRFNDTPQNEQDDVDYNVPDYASNMGKSMNVSKVDSGSVAAKLKELQDNFKSIILEWSNEFDGLFVDEYFLEGF